MDRNFYSVRSLKALRRRGDSGRVSLGAVGVDRTKELAQALESRSFDFGHFKRLSIKGKPVFVCTRFEDQLALRAARSSLAYSFRLRFADRHDCIGDLVAVISEPCPKTIVRFDIKEFYESVDRKIAIEQIEQHARVPETTEWLLRKLFAPTHLGDVSGLPRGIGVSAALGEIALRELDAAIRLIPGVYYYGRYVDDAIVVSTTSGSFLMDTVRGCLAKAGLELNEKKSSVFECDAEKIPSAINFLGYQIGGRYGGDNFVRLSVRRYLRTRQRLESAIGDFLVSNDFTLLRDRVAFLTSNYRIEGRVFGSSILSGIFYSNRLLTGNIPSDLQSLDRQLTFLLFKQGSGHPLSLAHLATRERRDLAKMSFVSGFKEERYRRFPLERIHAIREIWRNA